MKQLYFVRHGQSELNAQQIYAGQTDTPLTDQGRLQAAAAGMQAATIGVTRIVASPLSRTRETADIIADAIGYPRENIIFNEVFIEQSYGSLEGQPWSTTDLSSFTDIETDEALTARAASGLAYLQSLPDDVVLLVGHGSYARALRNIITGQNDDSEPANAMIVRFI